MKNKSVVSIVIISAALLLFLFMSGEEREEAEQSSSASTASVPQDQASATAPPRVALAEGSDLEGAAEDVLRVVRGRVLDEEDLPVAGARIRLTAFGRDAVDATSGTGGEFEAEVKEQLPLLVSASAEGYLPDSTTIRTYSEQIELVLRRGRSVSGIVLSGDRPIEGATVVTGSARATSDSAGAFLLENLPAGPVAVEARHGMSRSQRQRLDLSDGSLEGLILRLKESGSLEVRVRTGQEIPVENALVRLSPMGWGETLEASTGEDGNVLFEDVPAGSVRVAASAQGLASAETNGEVPSGDRQVMWLSLTEAHALVVNTRLEEGTPLSREIVTLRLVPESGEALDSSPQGSGIHQKSAGIGEPVVFESVAAGSWRALAHHPGYSSIPVPAEVPGPDVTIVLQAGGEVSGRVVDEEGASISGAFVIATPALVPGRARADLRPARRGRTDADGEFRIQGLAGEGWRLLPRMQGYTFGQPVPVNPGETDVLLRMEEAKEISGQVVDGRGVPLASVRVVARAIQGEGNRVARVASDAHGGFLFENLTSGRYELQAHRGARKSEARAVDAPEERVRLVIPVGATLKGRVSGPGGAAPARYTVLGFSFSEPSGAFQIEDLDPGVTLVPVEAPGLLRKTVQVTLRDDGVMDMGTVSLSAPASIEGSVGSEDGRPVEGATVVLEIREGEDSHNAIASTDSEGRFSFTGLALGRARLHVLTEDDQSDDVETHLAAGRTAQVRLVVP